VVMVLKKVVEALAPVERIISQKGQERKPLAQIALWRQSDQGEGVSLGDGGGTSAPVEAL
jgi:hypothetical protein